MLKYITNSSNGMQFDEPIRASPKIIIVYAIEEVIIKILKITKIIKIVRIRIRNINFYQF